MTNAYLLFDDRVPSATLSGTSPASGLPLANMQDPQPRKVARWLATTGYVVADFGSSMPVGAVIVHGTNLSAAATRRVRLSSADATGAAGDVHDSGTATAGASPNFMGSFAYTMASDLSARYLRVDLTDTSLQWIDIGLLMAGPTYRPTRNFSFGWQLGYREFGLTDQSPIGVTFASQRGRGRAINMRFAFATAAEAHTQIFELQRIAGATANVAVIPDPSGTYKAQQLIVGTLADLVPIQNDAFNVYSATVSVLERI